jgi:drug/metabolite transporter (DMT)-like permease
LSISPYSFTVVSMDHKSSSKVFILAGLTVALWSSGFVFTRVAVVHLSTFSVGFLRYFSAAIPLVIIALFKKIGLPKGRDIPLFLALGALGFALYQLLFNVAMLTISASTASVIVATVPVVSALFASAIFKERLNKVGWIAVIIEFSGILLLTLWQQRLSVGWGLAWMGVAALCFAAYNLLQRFATANYTPLQSITYSIVASVILLLPFAPSTFAELSQVSWQPIAAVVYMGVFPSALGFILWAEALVKAKQMSDVTNFMFLTPLLSALLEFLIIGDLPDLGTIIGGTTILIGLLLFNNRTKLGKVEV